MLKMKMRADLPKMPRLPIVPLSGDAPSSDLADTTSARVPPSPSAYRLKNPYAPPPGDYKAPSMLAEHRGLAIFFLAAALGFALYCWRAPARHTPLDAPAPAQASGLDRTQTGERLAGSRPSSSAAEAHPLQPIYVEPLPDNQPR